MLPKLQIHLKYRRFYVTPCINFLIFLLSDKINSAAANGIIVKIKKKPTNPVLLEILSICSAITAANFPDNPVKTYQIPNKNANILAGANLLTYERPTGEIESSPIVCNKNAKMSQIILTDAVSAPLGIVKEPNANIPKPNAKSVNPIANF